MIKRCVAIASILFLWTCSSEEKRSKEKITQKDSPRVTETVFAKLDLILGQVEFSADGKKWSLMKRMDSVKENDWIRTGNQAKARVRFWENSVFVLGENTTVCLKELTSGKKMVLKVEEGKVISKIEKLNPDKNFYKVQGPAMVAGVRGTVFEFSVTGNKNVLTVKEGIVAAKRDMKNAPTSLVGKDQGVQASVDENQRLAKAKKSLKLEVLPSKKLKSGFVFFESDFD